MQIIQAIDLILQNVVVRWMLLVATVAALATATWCKIQIGTVRLQRDAAQGQSATYQAHLQLQNEAIIQMTKEHAAQQQRIATATAKAKQLQEESNAWRKKALNTPLTGSCEEMVNQVIESIRQ